MDHMRISGNERSSVILIKMIDLLTWLDIFDFFAHDERNLTQSVK